MAKIFKNYREQSKIQWGTTIEEQEPLNKEQIATGCMLRIADATEAMATNHVKLQNDYDYMRRSRDNYREENAQLLKRVAGLKGQITKLKKNLK